jgi:uncharacterized protein (TIGR03435 family)
MGNGSPIGLRMAQQCAAVDGSVGLLSNQRCDRPVVDGTELDGRYDIELRFSVPATGRIPPPNPDRPLPPPAVKEAVRDQLGLILEKTSVVVADVLVFDHVEKKPTK